MLQITYHQDYEIHWLGEVTSTMDIAKIHAINAINAHSIRKKTIIIAEKQTNGRGRIGRKWESGNGNLYCSVVMYPSCTIGDLHKILHCFSLAVAETIDNFTGFISANSYEKNIAKCKWPNDVYIDDKKIAGILVESSIVEEQIDFVVIGIGVNLASSFSDFPSISLSEITQHNRIVTRQEFIAILCEKLEENILIMERSGFLEIKSKWLLRAWKLGEEISVMLPNGSKIIGIFTDLADDGSILLETHQKSHKATKSSEIVKISLGEVCGIS